ncbi:MAG: hypothetical protein AAF725_19525, partial [Acidobacteriota bacterium]
LPPPRGYFERACGFDLNDDGRSGEPEDCRVCDGSTRDPDGDGVREDLLYVDCDAGVDSPSCGSPSAPCRTLEFALVERADGAADGAEDIVCFTGVCAPEALTPATGGVAGVRLAPRVGHQSRDFEMPRDPAMLVGWDRDADGVYPPADPDDLSVLDGSGSGAPGGGLSRPFVLTGANSRFEMAHFEARNYGRFSDVEESGFVRFAQRGGTRADHFYFHNLSLRGINRDQPAQSHRIVFNFFTGGTSFHHVAFVNLEVLEAGGFMVRGAGPYLPPPASLGGDDGPYRWQRLTVSAHGCDDSDESCRAGGGSAFIGWKLWGYLAGIEILDSVFDANLGAWDPKKGGNGGAVLVSATQCSRDWWVRNNAIYDFKVGFRARGGWTTYCGHDDRDPPRQIPRPTDFVRFDRNLFLNAYDGWHHGDWLVHLEGGEDAMRSLRDVSIRDNVLISSAGFDACFRLDAGHTGSEPGTGPGDRPGTLEIVGNLCRAIRDPGAAAPPAKTVGFEIGRRYNMAFPQQRIVLRDNVISGLAPGDLNIRLSYLPEELVLDNNVWSPGAGVRLERQALASVDALAERASPGDLERPAERVCQPLFDDPPVNAASLRPRLHPEDACLRAPAASPPASASDRP